jgi:hypothetical protein
LAQTAGGAPATQIGNVIAKPTLHAAEIAKAGAG